MEAVSLPKNLVKKKLPKANLFKVAVFSVFTFLLTAPQPAHAGIADDIANFFIDVLLRATFLFTGLVTTFVAVIVNMFLTVVAFFFKLVLDWAITVALNTSYTSGQVFLSGWPILRDLANMALILILVGIGIGTMLSLRGRSFLDKSRLPMFILVALLINFTPVITGVIIDFTNIVANVFWLAAQNVSSAFISTNVGAQITQDGTRLVDSITNVLSLAADENRFGGIYLSLTVESVASIVLNIVVIFTFTLLTALFLGRTLALMLLVILSPVAFLGLIWGRGAKARNSLWEKWWHNFLQWSIIVIPLLFFMWLGGVFTQANEVICSGNTAFPGAVGDLANNVGVLAESGDRSFVCGAVTMAFAAATMMWGILISFNTSNKTARAVIGKTKQFAQASAKWAGKKGALYTKKVGAPRARDVTRKIANTRVGRNKVLGAPLRSLARTTQKQVDQLQKEIKGYEKDYKNANNFSEIRADLYAEGDRGFAAMRVAADKFTEEFAKEMESSEKLQKNFKTYRTRSSIRQDKLDEDIIRRLPHLIETDKERKKIVGKMSYGDVMKLPSQSLKDPEFMNELMKNESINFNALHDIQRKS
ncbi:MAG: hypothetical protein R3251_03275, partial [Candidatus Spechtbacterales bacterium]|nr:hypothetical protein [Candidatus Spechtbacterales bacterium]